MASRRPLDRQVPVAARLWDRPEVSALLVIAVASAVFLFRLGSPPLTSPNEGLYAEIAREMLESGEAIIPHANTVVYLEKPPLLYWLAAGSMRVLGANAFAARLPSALAAIATALVVAAAGRRIFGRLAGTLAGVAFATSLGLVLVARQVLFDSLLTLWTTIALAGFWLGTEVSPQGEPRRRGRVWLLAGYAALGLGVLTKGLVAVAIPAIVAGAFVVTARDWGRLRRAWSWPGAVLFLAVAAPWHVAAAMRQKEFAWFYFVNEHWMRFLGRREPADFHADPVFAPAAAIFLLPLPWSVFLPAAVRREFSASGRRMKPEALFLLCWILAPAVFFTLSQTRTYYYLLPAVPAAALWVGHFWAGLIQAPVDSDRTRPRWLLATVTAAFLLTVAVWIFSGFGPWTTLRSAAQQEIWVVGGLWGAAGFAAAIAFAACRRPVAALAAVAVGFFVSYLAAERFVAAGRAGILHSEKAMAQIVEMWAPPDALVAVEGKFENHSSFGFYLPPRFQPVKVVDALGQGDLAFGSRLMADTRTIFISTNPMIFDIAANRPLFYLTKAPSRLNVPPWLALVACDDETMLWTNIGVPIPYPAPRP